MKTDLELWDKYKIMYFTPLFTEGAMNKEKFTEALAEDCKQIIEHAKGCVDRIWSDCFDSPPSFTEEQLSTISSAITQAKLDLERISK